MTNYLSEHWVCFRCRKQLRKQRRKNRIPWEFQIKQSAQENIPSYAHCPECQCLMINMGSYFRPPRRNDKRGWEQMRLLGEHGIRFYAESSVAYRRLIAGPNPGVRQAKEQIADCSCHTRTEGQRLLRKIACAKEHASRRK